MCKDCIRNPMVDRGTMCLDSGVHVVNFRGCAKCKTMDQPLSTEREETEEDGEETVVFKHECSKCKHVIARHEHTFTVEDGYQEYLMTCALCGRGADSRSVLPCDPRANRGF